MPAKRPVKPIESTGGSRRARAPGLLRVLAGLAVVLIPVAWLGSLAAEPALFEANLGRVIGALVAAAIAWVTYGRDRPGLPWQRCLAAGVAGSLAITGLSMLAPVLGGFTLAGWLMSGMAGGAMVVLTGFALTRTSRRD